jgi:hypothetical protein
MGLFKLAGLKIMPGNARQAERDDARKQRPASNGVKAPL